MRHDPETVTEALNQYHSELSCRKAVESVRRRGTNVHFTTIDRWNKKYAALTDPYLDSFPVRVGSKWNADELYARVKKLKMYLSSVMDGSARFCLSYGTGDRKDGYNAERLLAVAKTRAGKTPRVFVSDSLPPYGCAFDKVFAANHPHQKCRHISEARLKGKKNNNIEERLNGTFLEREKILCDIKMAGSPHHCQVHNILQLYPTPHGSRRQGACRGGRNKDYRTRQVDDDHRQRRPAPPDRGAMRGRCHGATRGRCHGSLTSLSGFWNSSGYDAGARSPTTQNIGGVHKWCASLALQTSGCDGYL